MTLELSAIEHASHVDGTPCVPASALAGAAATHPPLLSHPTDGYPDGYADGYDGYVDGYDGYSDDLLKKVQVLITDNTLPPAAGGQQDRVQNTTFAARTTPRVIFADMYDPQTPVSDPESPLVVHRGRCELMAMLGRC